MVRMKAKIYKLKQINEVNEVVKAWLDANVAYEFTLRNSVQQWIADRVSKAMMAALMQPQTVSCPSILLHMSFSSLLLR